MNDVNREKLRRELFAKDVSVMDLPKKLGITGQSFYIKLKGKRDFRESEICEGLAILSVDAGRLAREYRVKKRKNGD